MQIRELFANKINRRIEEVVKVDQVDQEIIREELGEYVVTDAIRHHYVEILEHYRETPNKPHEGVAIWVSGFFGSGKSSFVKMLGLAIEGRDILGESAATIFGRQTGDQKIQVLLQQIQEQIPTEAVIFDVSTDRGIRSGSQTLTEIMYRLFLKRLGYADDLDLAELEITLEERGELVRFEEAYREEYRQEWGDNKDAVAFALAEASLVMHRLHPDRFTTEDSWLQSAQDRADITPGRLAERCKELMDRRRPNQALMFVVDEVGQFVARDVQKMLDLQAVVQSLGRIGRGRMWIAVTSQEKLNELVGGLDSTRVELARLMDRFPVQVHLEPSDISEVTSKRVLSKSASAEKVLRDLYQQHSGRLQAHTRIQADVQLPELSAASFLDLYPLLPYQIDLIISVVSGLRTEGGASKHVGGANRTIIKLAQQLLIHEAVGLADQPVGKLARIDQIYDLVSGNISSEVRGKIASVGNRVAHRFAAPVAKAICLLQFVETIPRTPENLAAVLHPGVEADSVLPEVKEALAQLVESRQIRLVEGQYKIPTPAEDDWETTRAAPDPRPGDIHRIHADMVRDLWEPKPSHTLREVEKFRGGLVLGGRSVFDGDIPFHVALAEAGDELERERGEGRSRSQTERQAVFWIARLDDAIDRATVEVFRSREILAKKERSARTSVETSLVTDERRRQRDHESDLRRMLRDALLAGSVYFRGNDRSPGDTATSVSQAASRILGQILPDVYDRFEEGAARVTAKDLEAVLTNENLRGLPTVFHDLDLLQDQNGQPVFVTDSGPLSEVCDRIENRTSYGEAATGKYLAEELGKEPFGWSLDVVRLFVVCLVRAGKVKAKSKGTVIESALSVEARTTFTNNSTFKTCSFEPKVTGTQITDWLNAEEAFRSCFGEPIHDVTNSSAVASAIRSRLGDAEERLHESLQTLLHHRLPGTEVLQGAIDQVRAIRTGPEDDAILGFNRTHRDLKEAIQRAGELEQALTKPKLNDLDRARRVLEQRWPVLEGEPELDDGIRVRARTLEDLLARETFFRDIATIEQHATAIDAEHRRRFQEAVEERARLYGEALEELRSSRDWGGLNEEQQRRVAAPLEARATEDVPERTGIATLRAECEACGQQRRAAEQRMMELIDGNLLVTVKIADYFSAKMETPEQLDAALKSLRQRVEKLIGEGKRVLVR